MHHASAAAVQDPAGRPRIPAGQCDWRAAGRQIREVPARGGSRRAGSLPEFRGTARARGGDPGRSASPTSPNGPSIGLFDGVRDFLRHLRYGSRGGTATAARGSGGAGPAANRVVRRACPALLRDAAHSGFPRAAGSAAATVRGYELARKWRPDIVVASAAPNSGLIRGLADRAELRRAMDRRIARFMGRQPLLRGSGLPPWSIACSNGKSWAAPPDWSRSPRNGPNLAPQLSQAHRLHPQRLRRGGFPDSSSGAAARRLVSIVYTGNIYLGYRDRAPLFHAIGLIGAERKRVVVHSLGPPRADVEPLASQSRGRRPGFRA